MSIKNAVVLGPSTSGKTSVCEFLAKKFKGIRISLDGVSSAGRLRNTIINSNEYNKFSKIPDGIAFRLQMINEVKEAIEEKVSWFIDDIDPLIIRMLYGHGITKFKIIILLPKISKISSNVVKRNIHAKDVGDERNVENSLSQLVRLIEPCSKSKKCIYSFTFSELFDAFGMDKHLYTKHFNDQKQWSDNFLNMLNKFGIMYDFMSPPKKNKTYYFKVANFGANFKIKNKTKVFIIDKKMGLNKMQKKVLLFIN